MRLPLFDKAHLPHISSILCPSYIPLTSPFFKKNYSSLQELKKTVLQVLNQYLFHSTVEIRDPQISKLLRKQSLPKGGITLGGSWKVMSVLYYVM
jgi:hypothetical protein